jgi:hypothetical protein
MMWILLFHWIRGHRRNCRNIKTKKKEKEKATDLNGDASAKILRR